MVLIPKQPEGFDEAAQEALASTYLLLQKLGPSCFLLLDPNGDKQKYKVTLGSPHVCSCSRSGNGKIACVHILFVILKILGVPPNIPLTWRLKVNDQEVIDLLLYQEKERDERERKAAYAKKAADRRESFMRRKQVGMESATSPDAQPAREVDENDVCPICHDPLLIDGNKKKNNAWCQSGCGQSFHVSCMHHWVEHRSTTLGEKQITCPMCRIEWTKEQVSALKNANNKQHRQKPPHQGTICKKCRMIPIRGKLFFCVLCDKTPITFCEECYAHGDRGHQQHPFCYLTKPKGIFSMAPNRTDMILEEFAPQDTFPFHVYLARLLSEWEPPYELWRKRLMNQSNKGLSRGSVGGVALRGGMQRSGSARATTDSRSGGSTIADQIRPRPGSGQQQTCAWQCNIRPVHVNEPERGRVIRLRCGHVGHVHCAQAQFQFANYDCPICEESLFLGLKAIEDLQQSNDAKKEMIANEKKANQDKSRIPSVSSLGSKTSKINRRPPAPPAPDPLSVLSLQVCGVSL